MIKMYWKPRIIYCVLIIVGFTGIGMLEIFDVMSRRLGSVCGIVWVFIAWYISRLYAKKLPEKVNNILMQECNTKDYIAFYEKCLRSKNVKAVRSRILLDLSTGYYCAGNFEETKRVLDSLDEFSDTKDGIVNSVCYYNNLAGYYLTINDLINAEKVLELMKSTSESPKLSAANRERYHYLYIGKNFALNMRKGDYEGAEEHLKGAFDKEKNMLGRVSAKYNLGKLYKHFGAKKQAIAAFEYVLENGNQTYYTQKAREYLDDIDKNSEKNE